MNPEQWLSLKWNGGSTMSDRWLNQSKIIQGPLCIFLNIEKHNNLNFIDIKKHEQYPNSNRNFRF